MKNTFDLNRYQFGVGRRKTSTARVYLEEGNGKIIVNNLPFEEYFSGTWRNRKHAGYERCTGPGWLYGNHSRKRRYL